MARETETVAAAVGSVVVLQRIGGSESVVSTVQYQSAVSVLKVSIITSSHVSTHDVIRLIPTTHDATMRFPYSEYVTR